MSDSPRHPGGYQPSEEPAHPSPAEPDPAGGYEPPPPEPPARPLSETTVEPVEEDEPPVAAERFRRTTPARRKVIPPHRGRGHWRLLTGTLTYVMVVGGMADYVEPETRALAHLAFWLVTGIAFLVTLGRERRHGWEPGPRWPWLVGAFGGALAVEGLVLTVGSPTIIVGSVILLGFGLFVLMLMG
ncbi:MULTISPECIES: hypothetical protein [Nocardiopsis]|uniref:Uncharacterized protein n=1 Tax=Nocardiopsis sinuspersici TaxID=501010 RepID=A0A1V3C9G7_9ACTN|nr:MULTISPECIES: hypothetical protein [Nocardiopsis]NYH52058.1 hypothetical protein [Nocardiopsis sinuspersici]OOC57298.1 hypothetical protein NOSIN_18695 [Nocardiopsis sinuspersici]